jgi:hypothetical protein
MKRKALSFVLIAMLVTIPFAACAPSTENTPSVDEQVQTAVAATATAEAERKTDAARKSRGVLFSRTEVS